MTSNADVRHQSVGPLYSYKPVSHLRLFELNLAIGMGALMRAIRLLRSNELLNGGEFKS